MLADLSIKDCIMVYLLLVVTPSNDLTQLNFTTTTSYKEKKPYVN